MIENKIKIRSFERKRVPVQKMCISFLLHYTNARTNYQCGAVKKQLLIIAAFKYSTWREGNRNLTNCRLSRHWSLTSSSLEVYL